MKDSYLILSLLVTFLLIGCEKRRSDIGEDEDYIPLEFSIVSGSVMPMSKAALEGVTFPVGSHSFGIAIYNHGTDQEHMLGYEDIEARTEIITGGVSSVWYFDWNDPSLSDDLYYQSLSVKRSLPIDIYAYYPLSSDSQATVGAIPFTTDMQNDWLYAKAENLIPEGLVMAVPLEFEHAMTCIEVSLKNNYTGSITMNSISLSDTEAVGDDDSRLCYSGMYNAKDGTVMNPLYKKTINLNLGTGMSISNKSASSVFFILPAISEYDTESLELRFVFNDEEVKQTFKLPTNIGEHDITATGFEKGKKYKFVLTIDNIMKFQPDDIKIGDWQLDETMNIEL